MPKRTDVHKILIIGAGPIVIGQGCEFDYSGTQACKALKEEGFEVVLVNSNPATIMTDPQFADRTYIEPITPEVVEKILVLEAQRGRPIDAVLPTLGGQTALNCACACFDRGILARHNVQMIGASRAAIQKAEGRVDFKEAMLKIGLDVPNSVVVRTWEDARDAVLGAGISPDGQVGVKVGDNGLVRVPLPVVIRPAFTLGGTGGGFAFTAEEFETIAQRGLAASPIHEILVEESCLGWKEYEMEVMRDHADNVVIICSIENFDPMGVHTGDSITVAPAQTLTDKEYQRMRDASIRVIREIGVDTGGSNIQFAIHPQTGRMIVIEMNPRVSRSSALASKATGYPIARIAAKLAVGYTLDELPNEITKTTRASFEPVIDYCVIKIPRFTFEKFPEADETLTTQMKSVGEAMAIGRTFKEALQKGIRSMEIKRHGLGLDRNDKWLAAQRSASRDRQGAPGAPPTPESAPLAASRDRQGAPGALTYLLTFTTYGTWLHGDPRHSVHYSKAGLADPLLLGDPVMERSDFDRLKHAPTELDRPRRQLVLSTLHEVSAHRGWNILAANVRSNHVHVVVSASDTPERVMNDFKAYCTRRLREAGLAGAEETIWTRHGSTLYLKTSQAIESAFHYVVEGQGTDLGATYAGSPTASPSALPHGRGSPRLGGSTQSEAPADTVEHSATEWPIPDDVIERKLSIPGQGRLYYVRYAFKSGWSIDDVHRASYIDPWFLAQMKQLVDFEDQLRTAAPDDALLSGYLRITPDKLDQLWVPARRVLALAKQWGYSDVQIASAWQISPQRVRELRNDFGMKPVYKLVDTCASEFVARTPYYYSTYERPASNATPDDEIRITPTPKVVIIGGGPNRIGQGIEFDYCCVHAAWAARELGFESVMINSNPETVSTDFDTSDMLFFEPLTHEDVLNICERFLGEPERARSVSEGLTSPGASGPSLLRGVICQFGGQTPLNLARGLHTAGVPLLGTSVDSIELAEDRDKFQKLLQELGLRQPPNGTARTLDEARQVARRIGYPVLIRPGFVLGGRGMEICNDESQLARFMQAAIEASEKSIEENPVLIDKFLDDADEVDVDAVADGTGDVIICGILEHIEEAGVHSGDAAMSLPPYTLSPMLIDQIRDATVQLARRLSVCGLMNVQYAIQSNVLYVLEVNPRASRTVPFVAKATGTPWARVAAKCMLGVTLREQGVTQPPALADRVAVKESVFPFAKFPGVDVILGPEMRSTGEVMGLDRTFALAFAKSQMAANASLPTSGTVFISVRDRDKPGIVPVARKLAELSFKILSSAGTLKTLRDAGIDAEQLAKIQDGTHPNILDLIKAKSVQLIINTPTRRGKATDEGSMRAAAVMSGVPMMTTVPAALAAAGAIEALRAGEWNVRALQDYPKL